VLVLAIILNPRAKRVAERGEQKSRDGARVGDGGGIGDTVMAVMPESGVQDNK